MTLDEAYLPITQFFDAAPKKIYTQREIASILKSNRPRWKIPHTVDGLIRLLLHAKKLYGITNARWRHSRFTRYVWGNLSPYTVALGIRPNSYLSHGTAAFLQGLVKEEPKSIYVNQEQSQKTIPSTAPTQETIDQAFSSPQRQSTSVLSYEGRRIVLLSGKNTNELGVKQMIGPARERLRTTGLERTLIDIVVRPAYAGGSLAILEAFRAAKDQLTVRALILILRKLQYVYPYHQAIGFFMESAGFERTQIRPLSRLGSSLDFYVEHKMSDPAYDTRWRVYYPKELR